MNSILSCFLLTASISAIFQGADARNYAKCRWHPYPMTRAFCSAPPVVSGFDIRAYGGTWYQAYVNPEALSVSSPSCVTANYTLRTDGKGGKSVSVLNCEYDGTRDRQPLCVAGAARMRPMNSMKRMKPAYLQVEFVPGAPPGSYNVAAVLGDREYGYYAAAVYSCRYSAKTKKAVEGWFFLIRNPYEYESARYKLECKLACIGYNIYAEKLIPTTQGKECKYFKDNDGFRVISPGPPSGRRPPSA